MKKTVKALSFALALLLALSLLGSCSKTNEPTATPSSTPTSQPATTAPEQTSSEPSAEPEVTYPLADGDTFTCWWPNDLAMSGVQDYNDTPIFQYLEKKTGVHLEFKNPAREAVVEQYNLILVSGDLPDFMRQLYLYHTRGLDDAIDSGWFLNMMDYEKWTPNLFSRLRNSDELFIQAITDSGYLVGFPMLMSSATPWVNGMMIRGDWLDKYGLQKPSTIAEVENVLTVFRDNEEAAAKGPLFMNNMCFTGLEGSYNMPSNFGLSASGGFIYRDGAVRASVLEPSYKEYVQQMVDWYAKGLINPDFVNVTAYIAIGDKPGRESGKYGITYDCFVYLDDENKRIGGGYRFDPLAMPVAKAGDVCHVLGGDKLVWPGALGISTACKNVELACRYWDYLYSDEGSRYANFGEEGVTMEYGADGKPHLNDFAKKNPDMNLNQVENYYTLLDGPFYREGYREYEALPPEELACGDEWMKGDNKYNLPSNLSFTTDEGTRKASIMSDVQSFVAENQIKFVTGVKPMSEFDAYIEQVKAMGIEEVITMYENAFERYNNRLSLIKK